MLYYGLAALLGVVSVLILGAVIAKGWRVEWLWSWLKGNLLLLSLLVGLILALAAWDLHQFKPVQMGSNVGTLTFIEVAPQQFNVQLSSHDDLRLKLEGDLWEMDVQVLRWRGLGYAIGLQDGYRLHRLAGRYLALEQQRDALPPQQDILHGTPSWRDLWYWLDRLGTQSLLEADAFTLRFIPMVDGATFNLEIGATGLTPVPMNEAATEALERFE
ncbi:MAG: hypothetical protein KBT85_05190 [Pseudomonas sp.]|nr:hypothetical protein [Pseudomonas sp.]